MLTQFPQAIILGLDIEPPTISYTTVYTAVMEQEHNLGARGELSVRRHSGLCSREVVRLRSRHLGAKRSLALREFALGIESLERFVRCEPLRRVHECVFGVLALESEPVDPRL